MSGASKELAVTTNTANAAAVNGLGFGRGNNNNWVLWILVILFIFFFCGGNEGILGNWGGGNDCKRRHHHHHHHHDHHDNGGNIFNFFGENGWFILIIFAILFLFNDGFGGSNTNIINVDTEDNRE